MKRREFISLLGGAAAATISTFAFNPKKSRSAVSTICDDAVMSTTKKASPLASLWEEVGRFWLQFLRNLLEDFFDLSAPDCIVTGVNRKRKLDHYAHGTSLRSFLASGRATRARSTAATRINSGLASSRCGKPRASGVRLLLS